jgi:hypothetical protein
MHAKIGDHLIVRGPRLDMPNRDAEVIEVRGKDGLPPYLIRWSDTGHEGLYFPGSDSVVETHDGESKEH